MSQTAAMRHLDSVGMAKIKTSPIPGSSFVLSDVVTVTVPLGSPVVCDAYIDRTRTETGGDQSQVSQPYVTVTLQRSQIDDCPDGTTIAVAATGESFVVDNVLPGDSSMIVCVVSGG